MSLMRVSMFTVCEVVSVPATLVAKQFFQLLARGGFALVAPGLGRPGPANKFKILAEIAHVLFQHRLGPALAALLGRARVVMRAVQTDAQVGPAFHAGLAAPRLAGQRPFLAAVVAVTGRLDFGFAHAQTLLS